MFLFCARSRTTYIYWPDILKRETNFLSAQQIENIDMRAGCKTTISINLVFYQPISAAQLEKLSITSPPMIHTC